MDDVDTVNRRALSTGELMTLEQIVGTITIVLFAFNAIAQAPTVAQWEGLKKTYPTLALILQLIRLIGPDVAGALRKLLGK